MQDNINNEVANAQRMINNRIRKKYTFYIYAMDVFRYGPSDNCPGCKFMLGEVATQCGHTPVCKARIMDAMTSDKDDRYRVQRWFTTKGIGPSSKDECSFEDMGNKRKAEQFDDAGEPSSSTRAQRLRTAESLGSRDGVNGTTMGQYAERSRAGSSNDQGVKRQSESESCSARGENKKGTMCLNPASEKFVALGRQDIIDQCLRTQPIFAVVDSRIAPSVSGEIRRGQ